MVLLSGHMILFGLLELAMITIAGHPTSDDRALSRASWRLARLRGQAGHSTAHRSR
jgi:hypothetical protein